MVEFDVNQMTEEDLLNAANSIFTTEEKDFSKIKSEKWYQTLFHAITLNQDGKKYAVKGIHSLAKLQQLFMAIYVKNYRQSHEQLDTIIKSVSSNSEAIKKLYGACILNFEEQVGLSSLDATDSEILALFLGEYRNNGGVVPEEVQKYNRGVLNALQHHIPNGTLDSHQIRRLKNPKVVYRCFMEQSAVDGTIDSQEWSDKIYEVLKDFELSDNSKAEIKASVKREAEIAGTEYFLVKYTRDNVGVFDSDFELDFGDKDSVNSAKNELNEMMDELNGMRGQLDLLRLNVVFGKFLINNILNAENSLDPFGETFDIFESLFGGGPLVTLESLLESDVEDDISAGIIRAQVLIKSVEDSKNNDAGFIHAYKLCTKDRYHDEHKLYFFIATIDGLFFFIDDRIAYVHYSDINKAEETSISLNISSNNVKWYDEDGCEIDGDNNIVIKRDKITRNYIRGLRKNIEEVIKICGGYVSPVDDAVEEIVKKYINRISKGTTSKAYLVSEFKPGDEKNKKRLKNALAKYAHKVRKDDVIGFIDTSLFGNGGDGILFAKDGIAFDYAFEKIFVKYEEIYRMTALQKELHLCGIFLERSEDYSRLSISGIYFDLDALKECIEEIQRYI